jgi:subtilisin family serine protease
MARKTAARVTRAPRVAAQGLSASADELLLSILEQGGDPAKTGRMVVTFKEGAMDAGLKSMQAQSGMRVAHARDFQDQAVDLAQTGGADAIVLSEIGVAVMSGEAAAARSMTAEAVVAEDSPMQSIDPEYFMFAAGINPSDYLKGALRAIETIYADLGEPSAAVIPGEVSPEVAGATWGLVACKVPPSSFNGNGIKVAVLDTGFDLGHPEFAGRSFTTNTFVGQPVQDLHGHGTHTAGTACGPQAPAGSVPRYGIGFRTQIFIGKVLSNSGSGTQLQVLAGMNWAIANRCAVISMSLGAPIPVQPAYTNAGAAALAAGCLIVAAAGNNSTRPTLVKPAGAPANSPTIMSVGALDSTLRVAVFSDGGKVDIAGPGVNVFSSWPRPVLHNTISGTSMATPHVAGCAALWAQSSAALRGPALRAKLIATARHLPLAPSDVGAGLVQAP